MLRNPLLGIAKPLCGIQKKRANAQIAQLVLIRRDTLFADLSACTAQAGTQENHEKPKSLSRIYFGKLFFAYAHGKNCILRTLNYWTMKYEI